MLIFIIIFAILSIIAIIPLGVDGGYRDAKAVLYVKVGPVNVRIFPSKKGRKFFVKRKKGKNKEDESEKDKKFMDNWELKGIIKAALEALARLKRKLIIDHLRVHYTMATSDPFTTATGFGIANCAASASLSLLENAFHIKDRDVSLNCDFLADKPVIDIWLTATIKVWEAIYIAAGLGLEYLKVKHRSKKTKLQYERNENNG